MKDFASQARRLRLALALLVERRVILFVAIEVLVIGSAAIGALIGGEHALDYWPPVVLIPMLLIGLPALSSAVAVDRRAGSLELALNTGGGSFFYRRIAGFTSLLALQGMVLLAFVWLGIERFPLLLAGLRVLVLGALLAAIVSYWSLKLETAGGTLLASAVCFLALGKWTFANPIPNPRSQVSGHWVLPWPEIGTHLVCDLVLALAAIIFFLYAQRRAARPERILR